MTSTLPESLVLGVATSAYQVEGAVGEGGRGESIWDRFAHTPGKVGGGDTGDVACDHYHRWREDLDLLAWLGVDAYRFSVAWPRVFPAGTERMPNASGLDFYDGLVDGLLARGIEPWVTLYHWDLPQALQDRGGWTSRETVRAFERFAAAVAARLGDRVRHWNTINEPWCAAVLGHETGQHAPGLCDRAAALAAAHHLLLAHGRSVPLLRDLAPGCRVGLVNNLVPAYPASRSEADHLAAERLHAWFNRWYLDPLYGLGYPERIVREEEEAGRWPPGGPEWLWAGDLETMAVPTDFLGINYYSRAILRGSEEGNAPREVFEPPAEERTDMGWEVYPDGLVDILQRVQRDYAPPSLAVTECGAAYPEGPGEESEVRDARRVTYLEGHLAAATRAMAAGIPLEAFFVWTLVDNFEWNHGFSKRFGLVWLDRTTQERVVKQSGHWLRRQMAGRNGRTS